VRIEVTRSGGFAGLVRRGEGDTALSPELAALAERADLSGLSRRVRPEQVAPSGGPVGPGDPAGRPDAFSYHISVDGGAPVTVPEHRLEGPLRELVDHVLSGVPPSSGRLRRDDDD
jgi:emfourin